MAAGADLTVTFSEALKLGTGNITLTDGAGDVRIIAVTDASLVSLNGQLLTINPTADLHTSATRLQRCDGGDFLGMGIWGPAIRRPRSSSHSPAA